MYSFFLSFVLHKYRCNCSYNEFSSFKRIYYIWTFQVSRWTWYIPYCFRVNLMLVILILWCLDRRLVSNFTCTFCLGRLQWSSWGPKTPCSVTCGEGERKQRRYCQVTRSSNGSFTGRRGECKGEAERVYPCFELACPQGMSHVVHLSMPYVVQLFISCHIIDLNETSYINI